MTFLPWPKRRPPKTTHGPKRIPWATKQPEKPQEKPNANLAKKHQAQRQGQNAENRAQCHLEQHGLVLVDRNHRCRCGELDLIMAQGRTAVIVEVRCRSSQSHGTAQDSITWAKQQRITRCASLWWQRYGQNHFTHLRFDVVADDGNNVVDWVQNAWGC